jgi:hypothetical protein
MSISNGHLRYKRYIKQNDGTYKLVSHWTSAETVEFKNGLTLEDSEVELTQAEYDALSEEEKMNGAQYFITDAESSIDEAVKNHMADTVSHITPIERTKWNGYENAIATNAINVAANTNAISQLNSDLKWKNLIVSGVSANNIIDISSIDFNEMRIVTRTTLIDGYSYFYEKYLLRNDLDTDIRVFTEGGYNSADFYEYCQWLCNINSVKLNTCVVNKTNRTEGCSTWVYYR